MRRNRNTYRKLFLACGLLPVAATFNNPGGDNGGGGGGDDPTRKKTEGEPKKLELTQAELDQRIKDALKVQQDENDRKAADQKKKDEDEAAKKKGEFEKLYTDEVAKGKEKDGELLQVRLTLRREQVTNRLRQHVADKHPEYLAVVDKYMAPHLKIDSVDLSDADADKQIAEIAGAYVKDNPRGAGAANRGTPNTPHRGKAPGEGAPPTQQDQPPRRTFSAVRTF